jgi:hypothetical protein
MRCPACGNDEGQNWHLCVAGNVVEGLHPPGQTSGATLQVAPPRPSQDPGSRGYVPPWAEKL